MEGVWNETKLEQSKTRPVMWLLSLRGTKVGFSSEGDQKQVKGFLQGSGIIKAQF